MSEDDVMEHFQDSRYVDVFITLPDGTWFFMFIAYTDLSDHIMGLEEFKEQVMKEVKYLTRDLDEIEIEEKPFGFYYQEERLIELTKENYRDIIEIPSIVIFVTQDTEKTLDYYHQMLKEKENQRN